MPNDNHESHTTDPETESASNQPAVHTARSTFLDTDGVTGIYYDGDAGVFLRVIEENDGQINVYSGTSIDGTAGEQPVKTYSSAKAFEREEPDAYPVPDEAVANPVQVAEQIYATGFNSVMDDGMLVNDIAALYADAVTTITEQENE